MDHDTSYGDEDLAAAGLAGTAGLGAAAAYGEKRNGDSEKPVSGMAGYGTLSMYGNGAGGNNNMAGRGSYTSTASRQMIGRDAAGNFSPLVPGQFVTSPNFNNTGSDSQRFSTASAGMAALYSDIANIGYPPVQQGQTGSARGPQATMMRHGEEPVDPSAHLPAHQDLALAAAVGGSYTLASAAAVESGNSNRQSVASTRNANMPIPTPVNDPSHINMFPSESVPRHNQTQGQGPFADPQTEGKIYIVTRVFEPSMPDELVFYPGDRIQIVVTYDDGCA